MKVQNESTLPLINNPELTNRLVPILSEGLGEAYIIEIQPPSKPELEGMTRMLLELLDELKAKTCT